MSLSPDVPIVIAASAGFESPSPVNAHQVARRLVARGHRVLFVESTGLRAPAPLAGRRDVRRMVRRLGDFLRGAREVAPGLHVLSPLALPGAGPAAVRRHSLGWLGAQVGRSARRIGMERPVLWAFLPTAVAVAQRLRARAVVYHCVDHYAANPGVDAPWIDALEERMLEQAHLVVATSPVLAERLRTRRPDVVLVPNGADVTLFGRAVTEDLAEPRLLRGLAHPRLVYIGNLAAYRVDFELLREIARRFPAACLVLIGARGLGDVSPAGEAERRLLAEPNVRVVPARPQSELPAFLRHCDVALVPFLDNEHTRASLPLKLWEYVAAGLPVVATDLPNLREIDDVLVRKARGPQGFARAISSALAEGGDLRPERLARARPHDWPARMEMLCNELARVLEERAAISHGDAAPL